MTREQAKRFESKRIRYGKKEYTVQQVTERVIICKEADSNVRIELEIEKTPLYDITIISSN